MSELADDRTWWFSRTGESEQAVALGPDDIVMQSMLMAALNPYRTSDEQLIPDDDDVSPDYVEMPSNGSWLPDMSEHSNDFIDHGEVTDVVDDYPQDYDNDAG